MLTGQEVFYNYWKSQTVQALPIRQPGGGNAGIKSIDILKFDDSEPNFFELLLGSDQGQIFHGVFQVDDHSGLVQEVEPFKVVL